MVSALSAECLNFLRYGKSLMFTKSVRSSPCGTHTDTTRFVAASLSKTFTATAALVLVQRGDLDLDTPVGAWLPELRPDVGAAVTLRHLLNHTSGLRREVFAGDARRWWRRAVAGCCGRRLWCSPPAS